MEQNERDIYYCNLPMVKMLKMQWAEKHPKRKKLQRDVIIISLIGLAWICCVLFWTTKHPEAEKWVLHVGIWTAALVIYLGGRYRNKICEPPFKTVLNVRVEMSDDGIYYIYQDKLSVITVFFADEKIDEMIYDEIYQVLYLKGRGEKTKQGRHGITEPERIESFYCLLPYDIYDIDDLFAPYGERVKRVQGILREEYK